MSGQSNRPKVSIVIPVYNGGDYLRQAIDSALGQTYSNIEILVVNDGSNDGGETERIALSYGERIRYFRKENGGVATALNMGIEHMEGEYFSWLSHDDMYAPAKIEEEIRALNAAGDPTTIIAEGRQVVDAKGAYLFTENAHEQYDREKLCDPLFLIFHLVITGCALLIHKSHFARAGMFDPALPTTQDYDLWFRMFRGQKMIYLPCSNVLSRHHAGQGSRVLRREHLIACDALWIRMMNALTEEERTQISGSDLLFYKEMLDLFRKKTAFRGAIRFIRSCLIRTELEMYDASGDHTLLEMLCEEAGFDPGKTRSGVIPLRNTKGTRARLLVYPDEHEGRGSLPQILEVLRDEYEIFVVTRENGVLLPEGCRRLRTPFALEKPAEKLAILAASVRADILFNADARLPDQQEAYLLAEQFEVRSILWNRETYLYAHWQNDPYDRESQNRAMAQADVCIWPNLTSLWLYSQFAENGAALKTPHAFLALKDYATDRKPRVLVSFGEDGTRNTGLEAVLRTFAELYRKDEDLELYLSCSYEPEARLPSDPHMCYRRLLQKLNVPEDHLHFACSDCIQKGFVNLAPAEHEGFCTGVLEAAASGVPSAAFVGNGADGFITDGTNGLLVPEGDYRLMAERVLRLMANRTALANMSNAARNSAQAYRPGRVKREWTAYINALLSSDKEKRQTYIREQRRAALTDEALSRKALSEYEAVSSYLQNQVRSLRLVTREQAQQIEGFETSGSWRMTAPLRKLKSAWPGK